MANSITKMLKWEVDIRENHGDNKLPVLDLKISIDNEDKRNIIKHSFYKKPVSSRDLIPERSALPAKMKKPILIQEGLRRIRNISRSSQLADFIKTVREYNVDMKISGYQEKFRLLITAAILKKYQAQLDADCTGEIKFYRTKAERKEYKKMSLKDGTAKTAWFQKDGFSATLIVPNTPNLELLHTLKKRISNLSLPNNQKVLLREGNGTRLHFKLSNAARYLPSQPCKRTACLACQPEGSGKPDCWKSNVTYKITCKPCLKDGRLSQYIGETGRSLYS